MKIETVMQKFTALSSLLRCPICSKMLSIQQTSLCCQNGHCYDLSKKGYVNFLPSQKQQMYDKQLFLSREQIFSEGFYQPVADALISAVKAYTKTEPLCILDAGCGGGYFARQLKNCFPKGTVLAADIAKEGIYSASGTHADIGWMVADIAKLPLQKSSMDIALNILTPANYAEFCRVLKPNGIFIKVLPGKQYLMELRSCAKEQLSRKDYSNAPVIDHLKEHMNVIQHKTIIYTLPLTQKQLALFLQMTPLLRHVNIETQLGSIHTITIELELLIAEKNRNKL